MMFTIQVLSQKVNKLPIISIDLCYIVTKKNTASLKNPVNPLNAELNPICHLLVLLGAHPIFHVSRIRVKHS